MLFSPEPGSGPLFAGSDKVGHLVLFALLAGTARWRFGPLSPVLFAVLGYAALSEVVQWLALEHRSGDVRDLVADAVGALLGWIGAARLLGRR